MLTERGKTEDGRLVLGGVFSLYETHGIPLDIILGGIQEQGALVDWGDFYEAALASGMKHNSIVSKLADAISDTYGQATSDVVLARLNARTEQ